MIIQHNIAALNSHRQLSINNSNTSGNLEKLSSGYRINRAADDAAGLAISEKMRGQIRGLSKAEENTSHAINLIQTAEGGLQETHAILQRMRELAVQSANGTYDNPNDRANLQLEFRRLSEEIDRISYATDYNGIKLLNGTGGASGITWNTPAAYTAASTNWNTAVTAPTAATGTNSLNDTSPINYEITLAYDASGNFDANKSTISFGGNAALEALNWTFSITGGALTVTSDAVAADVLTITGFDPSAMTVDSTAVSTALGETYSAGRLTISGSMTNGTSTIAAANVQESFGHGPVDGTVTNLSFQIGANGTADQKMQLAIRDMGAFALNITDNKYDVVNGVETTSNMLINIADQNDANTAINVINTAINTVSAERANLGAAQNRLEHTMNNLGVTKENLTAAESTIRDVDMAKEMMEYTKNSILVQASQAMLAQAQSLPQGVLQLLK